MEGKSDISSVVENKSSTYKTIKEHEQRRIAFCTVPVILKHGAKRLQVNCFLDEGSNTAYVNLCSASTTNGLIVCTTGGIFCVFLANGGEREASAKRESHARGGALKIRAPLLARSSLRYERESKY